MISDVHLFLPKVGADVLRSVLRSMLSFRVKRLVVMGATSVGSDVLRVLDGTFHITQTCLPYPIFITE